jgi:hypothetical protein
VAGSIKPSGISPSKGETLMPRLPILILSTIVLLMGAHAASAKPPSVIQGQTQPVNSGYCSFPVYRSDVFRLTTIAKPDGTLITHIDRTLTFAANGKTLTSNDHFTRFVDPAQPFLIDIAGHLIALELPGQGPVLLEVGHFIVDVRNSGAPILEAGQHDTLDHDTAAFCAYFAA